MNAHRVDGYVVHGKAKEWARIADALTLTQGADNEARRIVSSFAEFEGIAFDDFLVLYGDKDVESILSLNSDDNEQILLAMEALGIGDRTYHSGEQPCRIT